MAPFFNPDYPGYLNKPWLQLYRGLLAFIAIGWGAYALYLQYYGHDEIARWLFGVPAAATGGAVLLSSIALQARYNVSRRQSPAVVAAERRAGRYGWLGFSLLLFGAAILYAAIRHFGPATEGAFIGLIVGGCFALPGFVLMSYSRMVGTRLFYLPARTAGEELDEAVKRRTSPLGVLKSFASAALLAAMLAVAFYLHPPLLRINPFLLGISMMVPIVIWVLIRERRKRNATGSIAPVPAPPPARELTADEKRSETMGWVRFASVVTGVLWFVGVSIFGPVQLAERQVLVFAGLGVFFGLAGILSLYEAVRRMGGDS
jgi:hypothetical protein